MPTAKKPTRVQRNIAIWKARCESLRDQNVDLHRRIDELKAHNADERKRLGDRIADEQEAVACVNAELLTSRAEVALKKETIATLTKAVESEQEARKKADKSLSDAQELIRDLRAHIERRGVGKLLKKSRRIAPPVKGAKMELSIDVPAIDFGSWFKLKKTEG